MAAAPQPGGNRGPLAWRNLLALERQQALPKEGTEGWLAHCGKRCGQAGSLWEWRERPFLRNREGTEGILCLVNV